MELDSRIYLTSLSRFKPGVKLRVVELSRLDLGDCIGSDVEFECSRRERQRQALERGQQEPLGAFGARMVLASRVRRASNPIARTFHNLVFRFRTALTAEGA